MEDESQWWDPAGSSFSTCDMPSKSCSSQICQMDDRAKQYYQNMFEDKTFNFEEEPSPSFKSSKSERSKECFIEDLICSVDDWTTLEEFMAQVAQYTCDQGTLLYGFIENSISDFRKKMRLTLEVRNRDLADLAAEEQIALREKYSNWELEILALADEALNNLKTLLPSFNINVYERDPNYIRKLLTKVRVLSYHSY